MAQDYSKHLKSFKVVKGAAQEANASRVEPHTGIRLEQLARPSNRSDMLLGNWMYPSMAQHCDSSTIGICIRWHSHGLAPSWHEDLLLQSDDPGACCCVWVQPWHHPCWTRTIQKACCQLHLGPESTPLWCCCRAPSSLTTAPIWTVGPASSATQLASAASQAQDTATGLVCALTPP